MADGDPEDWPPQPEALRALDRCLRCPICLDIVTGPVALACGHSFCSRCIRDSLNVRIGDGQPSICPSCRKACDQADLRPVVLLREAATAWKEVRAMLLLQCLQAQQSQQHIGREQRNASQQQGFQLQQQQGAAGICHADKNKQQQRQQRQRQQQQQQHHRRERKRLNPDDPAQEDGCVITISDSEAAGNAGCDVTGVAEQTSGRSSGPEQLTPAAVDAVGGDIADGQHVGAGQQPAVQQQEQLAAGRLSGSSIRSCSNRRSSSTSSNGAQTGTQRVSLSSSPATTADLLRDQRQQPTQSVAAAEETSASSSLEHDGHDQDSDYNPEEAADTAAAAGIGGDDGAVADEDSDLDFEPLNPQPKRHKLCVAHHRSDGAGKENRVAAQALHQQQQQQQQQQQLATAPQQQQQQQQAAPRQLLPRAARAPRLQPSAAGYVACPICDLSVPQAFIHSHLDTCLAKADTQQQQPQQQQQQAPPIPGSSFTAAAGRSSRGSALGHGPGSNGGSKGGRTSSPAPLSGGSGGNSGAAAGAAAAAGGGAAAAGEPAAAPGVTRAGRAQVVVVAPPLEAPPKLCFELLKERNLKTKLADLGLSCEGDKKACVDRYTAFRNYVLSLKDSSSALSLVQAAAAFTRQQRSIARAAARPQSLDASLAAAAGKAGVAGGVIVSSIKLEGDVGVLMGDNSYAALIKQTRARMMQHKARQLQQQEQQQEQQEQQQV